MKKLLSIAMALVMIATTLFAMPLTAHAEEYFDLSNEIKFSTLEELRNAITNSSDRNTLF